VEVAHVVDLLAVWNAGVVEVVSLDGRDVIDKLLVRVKGGGGVFGRDMIALRVATMAKFLVLSTEIVKLSAKRLHDRLEGGLLGCGGRGGRGSIAGNHGSKASQAWDEFRQC
jgi:hypothetical protein